MIPEGLITTNKTLQSQEQQAAEMGMNFLSSINPFFQLTMFALKFLLSIFSLSIEIFLRVRLGERYLSIFALWTGFFILITLAGHSKHISAPVPAFAFIGEMIPRHTWMTGAFIVLFVIVSLMQKGGIFWRNWVRKIQHHSFAEGISIMGFLFRPIQRMLPFIPRITQRFFEPFAVFLFASFLPDPFLQRWLFVSAFCLLMKEALTEQVIRGKYLDIVDSQLEAQAVGIMATANNDPPRLTGIVSKHRGYSMRLPPVARPAQQATGGES